MLVYVTERALAVKPKRNPVESNGCALQLGKQGGARARKDALFYSFFFYFYIFLFYLFLCGHVPCVITRGAAFAHGVACRKTHNQKYL